MDEDLKVLIARQHKGFNCLYSKQSEIPISEIWDVKWDNQSGGTNTIQNGFSLYGKIDYDLAIQLVDCSGTHQKYGNPAKVLILRPDKTSPYWPGYQELCRIAPPKPHVKSKRPAGQPPCTKKILMLLSENSPMARGEIRKKLKSLGYDPDTITCALRNLSHQNRIKYEGSPNSKYQQLSLLA